MQKIRENRKYSTAPRVPAMGMVMNQDSRIFLATVQRTALYRSAAPTPMMEEETIWLADTGAPTREELRITVPAVSWDAKEWMGWTR